MLAREGRAVLSLSGLKHAMSLERRPNSGEKIFVKVSGRRRVLASNLFLLVVLVFFFFSFTFDSLKSVIHCLFQFKRF